MKPFSITKEEAAYLLNANVRTLTKWQNLEVNPLPILKAGKRGKESLYDPQVLFSWKLKRELSNVIEIDGEKLDLDEQRARLAKEQTEATALKNAQTRKEVAPIIMLEWVLGKIGSQISALLESLPLKIRRRVPKLSANEVDLIRREIVKAQNICSKITVDLDEYRDE